MTGPRSVIVACAFLALVLVVGTTNAAAQADEEYDKILPFIGHWDSDVVVPDGQDRGNCGGRTGDYGEKVLNCSLPADQLPLNARGEAWLKYVDQRQSPTTAECAQLGLPAFLTDGAFISASPGRVEMQHPTNPWLYNLGAVPSKPYPHQTADHQHADWRRKVREPNQQLVVIANHCQADSLADETGVVHRPASVREDIFNCRSYPFGESNAR